MKNIPNQEQAQEFDEHITHWQTVLNVQDWRMERVPKPAKNAMASVEFDNGARLATLRLGDFASTPITTHSLSMTALHETLHVFLHDFLTAAQEKGCERIEAEEHRVINVLEKLLGKDYANK